MPPYWIGNISEIWSEENNEGEEVGKKYYLVMISARPLSPHWFEILTTTNLVHFFHSLQAFLDLNNFNMAATNSSRSKVHSNAKKYASIHANEIFRESTLTRQVVT